MLTCKELTELVTEYLEGRMPFGSRVRFQLHVGMCRHCRAYLSQMKTTVQAVGALPNDPIPLDVRDELLDRFHDWRGSATTG